MTTLTLTAPCTSEAPAKEQQSLDFETLVNSVKKTGRLVIVEEGPRTGGAGASIAARICEEAFDYLDAPIKYVAGLDVPVPFAPVMENYVIPDEDRIIKAIEEIA